MKEQPQLEIHEVPVSELVPYINNAKKHSDYQVDTIAASISEFGNCDPIAVWHNVGGEMEIVEGHGRVMALKKLGIEIAPVIFLDHLTDEQRRAYTHVHNQTTLNSGFDVALLEQDIEQLDFDWESFGFDPISLASVGDDFDNGGGSGELSAEELNAYSESAEEECLKSFNVIISCMDGVEKAFVAELLGVEAGELKRFYRASDLMEEE